MDDIFSPKTESIARLTETSFECIGCHGKTQTIGKKEFTTAWGKQTWVGYEATFIDPHVKVKAFKKITESYITNNVYAGTGNHPVGVPYPINNKEYRNPPSEGILLPNGYVECESCHVVSSIDSEYHGELIISNENSNLCLACHKK